MPKPSRIMKVAGLSFVGFCAVSLVADKASLAPAIAQAAGFCGAFVGALVGRGRARRQGAGKKQGEAAPAEGELPKKE
jgi:hypothetical protein